MIQVRGDINVNRSPVHLAFALLVASEDACDFRVAQRGTATHFPPHITIRGRFKPVDYVHLNEIYACVDEIFRGQLPIRCTLRGPIQVHSCLQWLEVSKYASGYDYIHYLHRRIDDVLVKNKWISFDAVYNQHSGANFRPHLTLAWSDQLPFTPTPLAEGEWHTDLVSWRTFAYSQPVHVAPVQVLEHGFGDPCNRSETLLLRSSKPPR
jgi:hypothetical protein